MSNFEQRRGIRDARERTGPDAAKGALCKTGVGNAGVRLAPREQHFEEMKNEHALLRLRQAVDCRYGSAKFRGCIRDRSHAGAISVLSTFSTGQARHCSRHRAPPELWHLNFRASRVSRQLWPRKASLPDRARSRNEEEQNHFLLISADLVIGFRKYRSVWSNR